MNKSTLLANYKIVFTIGTGSETQDNKFNDKDIDKVAFGFHQRLTYF